MIGTCTIWGLQAPILLEERQINIEGCRKLSRLDFVDPDYTLEMCRSVAHFPDTYGAPGKIQIAVIHNAQPATLYNATSTRQNTGHIHIRQMDVKVATGFYPGPRSKSKRQDICSCCTE
jgi:hypothetical protein